MDGLNINAWFKKAQRAENIEKGKDKNVLAVFTRADELMYARKTEMKKHEKSIR